MEASGKIVKFNKEKKIITLRHGGGANVIYMPCAYEAEHELELLICFLENWTVRISGNYVTRLRLLMIDDYSFVKRYFEPIEPQK